MIEDYKEKLRLLLDDANAALKANDSEGAQFALHQIFALTGEHNKDHQPTVAHIARVMHLMSERGISLKDMTAFMEGLAKLYEKKP